MSPALRGHLAMLMFSALVAGSFSLGVMVANEVAPEALMAARFAIAGAVIGVLAALSGKLRRGYFRAPWRFLVLGGLFAAYFVLMFYGLQTAEPVSAAAVFTLTPVMSGVFGWLLLRQRTTGRMALALAIGAGERIYFWGCVAHDRGGGEMALPGWRAGACEDASGA